MNQPDFDLAIFSYNGLVYTPPSSLAITHEAAISSLIRLCEIDIEVIDDALKMSQQARVELADVLSEERLMIIERRLVWLETERELAQRTLRLVRRARGVMSFIA